MSSPNVWRAFKAYDKLFQKFTSFPIIFQISGKNSRIKQQRGFLCLKYFYLSWAVASIGCLYSIILIVSKWLKWELTKTVPFWVILFQVLVVVLASFTIAIQTGAAFSGGNLAITWTGGIAFEAQLRRLTNYKQVSKLDLLGLSLEYLVYFLAIGSYSTLPILAFVELDPFIYLLRQVVPPYIWERYSYVCHIIRYICCFIGVKEGLRMVWIACTLLALGGRLLVENGRMINKIKGIYTFITFHTRYVLFYPVIAFLTESTAFSLMAVGLVMGILTSYGAIMAYGVIPHLLYAQSCAVSIIIPLVISQTLPVGVNVHEYSMGILDDRKKIDFLDTKDMPYLKRKLKAMKPFTIYTGVLGLRLFPIVKSTKMTYITTYVDNLITALLSIQL